MPQNKLIDTKKDYNEFRPEDCDMQITYDDYYQDNIDDRRAMGEVQSICSGPFSDPERVQQASPRINIGIQQGMIEIDSEHVFVGGGIAFLSFNDFRILVKAMAKISTKPTLDNR